MALKVGELFASFNLDTSGIDGAVRSAESKMANLGKSLAIGGAGLTAAVTVPLKKAASEIYEAGSGFDAQMSKVFAIAGREVTGSAEAMDALRQKALEMGSTTQFTASEAGEAMEYMAMAGWKTEQMLAAIEPMMNLAAAAGADLGTTSDIITDAMTAFGYSATDTVKVVKDGTEMEVNAVEHFADVLAAASSNSNTNVTMLGESFKFAAPLAGALGYSVDDVAIALGLMANNGIKSSMAGTSLSRIIQNMAKPSKQTAEAMEALGVSLYNDRGEAKSLREVMGDFRIQAKKNGVDVAKLASEVSDLDDQFSSGKITEEQYTAKLEELTAGSGDFLKYVTQLAGARGLPGLLAIMNATDDDFESLCDSIDNATGSASEMKRVMLDNVKGDVTLFKSALEGLEITLWQLAEGGFRKVVQEATKFVDTFRQADKSTQLGVLKMGALAAATGPVMAGLGGLIAILPTLARTFTLVSGPTAMLAIGLLALGAAAIDSNNDIGRTFVKGMSRAGQKVRAFGKDVEKQLPAITANMGRFLTSLSTGIATGLPGIMDGLSSVITTAIQAISANMPKIANVSQTIVKTLANSIKKNAPKIVPAVLDLLTNMATALISNIPVVLEGMSTVITSLIKEVQSADWGEIGSKLGKAIEDAMKEVGTLFKKLAMGEQYVEDASWAQVGSAMVDNILSGIKTSLGNLRDFFGSLLLGDDYNPDENWTTFGTKLIDKIFEGADSAASGATEFVSGIMDSLANLFSEANISGATDALATIATRIITGVADEIPKLAGHATTILTKLSELLVGSGSNKGLAASATEGASKLAGAIITSIVQAIPHALDAAGNVLDAGVSLAGGILDSIISAFGKSVDVSGASEIGAKLKTFAQKLITGITTILPKLFTVGGKAISAGMKLASELVSSLAEGFTNGEGLELDLAGVAQGLVEGIVEAVGNLPAVMGDVLSAGAQIANSIMDSIATALTDMEASGVATSLGDAAVNLVKGLLTSIKDFGNNPDVKGFMTNLGKGFSAAMSMLGDIVGEIIAYILSPEGLSNLWDAGVALGGLLIDGIFNVLGGIGNFFNNIIEKTLDSWGIIDLEKIEEENRQLAEECDYAVNIADLFTDSMNNALEDGEASGADIISALFGYGINQLSGIKDLDDIAPGLKDSIASVWNDLWMLDSVTPGAVKGAMQPLLESYGIALEDISDELWNSLVTLLGNGDVTNQNELMNLLLADVLGIDPEEVARQVAELASQVAEDSARSAEEAKTEAIQNAQNAVPATLKDNEADIMSAANSASQAGVDAMQTTLVDGQEPVSDAAYQLGDAAVQQFLLTLSEENGTAIADAFIGGVMTAFSNDGTVEMAASVMAVRANNAVQAILTYAASFRIGRNFGQGLVNGINSMISAVSAAATALGNAAASALSNAIQEGSPSKLTAVTGRNFGLGFINAIWSSVTGAADAAVTMGRTAATSLREGVGSISAAAADQMSVNSSGRRSEAEALAAENEKTAMTYANAIANALNGARVVMNGELVGELVTDTVSEGIASRYAGMRYGTV